MSRVVMSEKQFAMFQDSGKPRMKGAPRVHRRREDLPENIVTKQITDYLRYRGWTVVRQHSGLFAPAYDSRRRIRIGEPGCTDWYAVRPLLAQPWPSMSAEFFYLEIKAPGQNPSKEQKLWMEKPRRVGFTAVWFDSLADFERWYKQMFGEARHG